MSTTTFYAPTIITQVDTFNDVIGKQSIPWDNLPAIANVDGYACTRKPITTVSGFWQEKFYSETSQIWATGFNIPDAEAQVVGIEVQVNVQRKARVQDLIIQLTLDGELIGDNRASLILPSLSDMNTAEVMYPVEPVGDYHVYGGDLWGTELTSADVANSSFGVVIAFKSNQVTPHSDLVYLDQVAIRIIYG